MFAAVLGFVSPWISDVFKFFTKRQENAHELEMLKESNKATRDIAELNAQVGMAQAEVDDVRSARAAQPSYGAKLLEAITPPSGFVEKYLVRPLLLVMLAVVEVLNGFMRPYAIYLVLSLWASVKVGTLYLNYKGIIVSEGAIDWTSLANAAIASWKAEDNAALEYVLGFLFGSRYKLQVEGRK